ncbi:STAS domain-containing protein [Chlamydiales bacterium]|nr:STAS domain-containing protein [Chlamydiales bacterium]
MEIIQEERANALIIRPHCTRLDLNEVSSFKELSKKLLETNHQKKVILDLADIAFMDSSGFGSLITINKWIKQKNKSLILTGFSPQIDSMFQILNLDKLFAITNTIEEALEIESL